MRELTPVPSITFSWNVDDLTPMHSTRITRLRESAAPHSFLDASRRPPLHDPGVERLGR